MTKTEAIRLFGSRPVDLAAACGVSRQVVHSWGEELTRIQLAQVQAAIWRRQQGVIATPTAAERKTKAGGRTAANADASEAAPMCGGPHSEAKVTA